MDCETRCEHRQSPRSIYDRADYVAEVQDCPLRQACTGNVDDGISRCQRDAFRRLEPSPAARVCCAHTLNKDSTCHVWKDQRDDYVHCIDSHKMYSDVILSQLDECNQGPCRARYMCSLDVVGHDEVVDDEDYQKKRRAVAVQDAGRATISFHGSITSETPRAPVPGARVCLQGTQQCATTNADGSYDLPTPAHAEVAVSFAAFGFEIFVNPLTTAGRDIEDSPTMQGVDVVRTRFAAVHVNAPDEATGMLIVKARTMDDKPRGIEGVSFAIDGAPDKTPWYSQPDGARPTSRRRRAAGPRRSRDSSRGTSRSRRPALVSSAHPASGRGPRRTPTPPGPPSWPAPRRLSSCSATGDNASQQNLQS